jgi:hypothetical protein
MIRVVRTPGVEVEDTAASVAGSHRGFKQLAI